MRLVIGQDAGVAAFVAKLMPVRMTSFENCVAIGVEKGNIMIAGAVFTDYHIRQHGKDIQISFAATYPIWANRAMIRGILSYPFVQLDCQRLTLLVAKSNKRARKLIEGLGFRLEGVHWRAYDGRNDAISYCLRKEDAVAKWLSHPTVAMPEIMEAVAEGAA